MRFGKSKPRWSRCVQQGLESVHVIKAFGRQDMEEEALNQVSQGTVNAALAARRIKSLLSPIVTMTVALCTAVVLWRGAALVLTGMDDGRGTHCISRLPHEVF